MHVNVREPRGQHCVDLKNPIPDAMDVFPLRSSLTKSMLAEVAGNIQ